MRIKSFLKIGLIIGVLLVVLSASAYAASVTSLTGSDGTNSFAATEDAVTEYTPLETTLTVSGKVDTASVNVTIMISAEDTVVYVNQTVADESGNFEFEFPVTLEGGYTYEVKVNTENSETASKLYFKTEDDEPVHYGDISGDGKLTLTDAIFIARGAGKLTLATAMQARIEAGLGDVNGSGDCNVTDALFVARYLGKLTVSSKATEALSWYTVN